MADRNPRDRRARQMPNEDTYGFGQAEQYHDSTYDQDFDTDQRSRGYGGQIGERSSARPDGGDYYYAQESTRMPSRSRGRGRESFGDYRQSSGFVDRDTSRGGANFDNGYDRGFGSFGRDDRSFRDVERNPRSGGTYLDQDHMNYGERSRGSDDYRRSGYRTSGYRDDYGRHDRGFFEKAGDEVASWFGDEDAARRRQMDHRGSGPSNYTRSDDRILEDACDNLTDDWAVDARNIQVTVKEGEVTLDGTVDSRAAKRRAEDCVDGISGVRHVQNNLRVQDRVGETADYSERELENGRI